MGFKCSLLGHKFDETAVERDRTEEGTEVVITITEIETCSRCGESRVVSENKEVTTMESPPETDADAPAADAAGGQGSDADAATPPEATDTTGSPETADAAANDAAATDPGSDDAEIIDADADAETDAQAEARSAAETTIPDAEDDAPAAAVEDEDAVILGDSDGADQTRQAAESDTARASEAGPADAQSSPRGPESVSPDDETAPADDVDGTDGAWPEESDPTVADPDDAADWPEESERPSSPDSAAAMGDWPEETKRDPGTAENAAGPDIEPTDGATITVPEGMFKCSACGFTTEVESSSLRAGDFCPECHSGTLVQHEGADEE
jgi:hypothetical protein